MTHDSAVPFTPTADDLNQAHMEFERNEPPSLFYKAAIELVGLALEQKTKLTVAEAIAVLLQTWNASYYRFRKFTDEHFCDIESLWRTHRDVLEGFRARDICGLSDSDQPLATATFGEFARLLGPVGGAKALHLLAPGFFPLWDNRIAARGYQLPLGSGRPSTDSYWRFMLKVQAQCQQIRWSEVTAPHGRLKALDEYNYIKYTWSQRQRTAG